MTTQSAATPSVDSCMVLMTNPGAFSDLDSEQQVVLKETLTQCRDLIGAKINAETMQVSSLVWNPDLSSDRLKKALAVPALRAKIQDWVARYYAAGSVTDLVYGSGNASLRQRIIQDLAIP